MNKIKKIIIFDSEIGNEYEVNENLQNILAEYELKITEDILKYGSFCLFKYKELEKILEKNLNIKIKSNLATMEIEVDNPLLLKYDFCFDNGNDVGYGYEDWYHVTIEIYEKYVDIDKKFFSHYRGNNDYPATVLDFSVFEKVEELQFKPKELMAYIATL